MIRIVDGAGRPVSEPMSSDEAEGWVTIQEEIELQEKVKSTVWLRFQKCLCYPLIVITLPLAIVFLVPVYISTGRSTFDVIDKIFKFLEK